MSGHWHYIAIRVDGPIQIDFGGEGEIPVSRPKVAVKYGLSAKCISHSGGNCTALVFVPDKDMIQTIIDDVEFTVL
jgi:hypothetical protein